MKRQCAQNIQDYVNPQKSNRFSPSPIKRYHNPRSLLSNDNKENIGTTTVRQSNINKRVKRLPLQIANLNQSDINNITTQLNSNTFEKMQIQPELTKQRSISNEDNELLKKNMDFENNSESISTKKRFLKSERKENELMSKLEKSMDDTDNQQFSQVVRNPEAEFSRKEQNQLINNKLDREIDSLMDGTYQSQETGPQGVQYQGRWTTEEHQKFVDGLKMFGKDWRKIEEYIGSRTCAQIRSHAQKYFNRLQREVAKGIPNKEAEGLAQQFVKQKKVIQPQHIESTQNPQKEVPIQSQTNQQIQQIHETLSKLAEDDLSITLRQLIAQREQICLEVLLKKIPQDQACEHMITITNRFHQLAMQALQQCKFEICNRMIDERNLTQFVCILFSKQVTITPLEETQGQEIIQRVQLSPAYMDSCQSLGRESLGGISHDRETAKSSPRYELQQHTKQVKGNDDKQQQDQVYVMKQ